MEACTFDGCGRRVKKDGLCNRHYLQKKDGLELKPLQTQHHGFSEVKRFLMRVSEATNSGCKEWQGSRQKKQKVDWHGQWRNTAGQIELAHRAAWRMFVGEIPHSMFVLHKCDNPACVNPNHLFLGTQSDNAKDMWLKGRAKPGKSVGIKHGCAKLDEAKVLEIRASNEPGLVLAKKYGVTQTTICDIRKRRSWNHL